MLKEFALTPQVFDPTAAPNDPQWREFIRLLATRLFTLPIIPVVITGLHACDEVSTWEAVTTRTIQGIEDDRLRAEAQSLFTQVVKVLGCRPACADWPGDEESDWGKEASDCHDIEPLHRVIAQVLQSVPETAPRRALSSVIQPDFWNVFRQDEPEPRTAREQAQRLRTMLLHSGMIVLSAPYIRTRTFVIECIREAVRRPRGFAAPIIRVFQEHPDNLQVYLENLRRELPEVAGRNVVEWNAWPRGVNPYRERVLLAGRAADVGATAKRLGVRWGVAMTHVLGEGNPAEAEPATFALLSATASKGHLDHLERRAAATPPVVEFL